VIFSQEPLAGNSTRAPAAAHRVTDGAEWLFTQRVRRAGTAGVVGTPTVKVNGTALPTDETLTAEALRNAVIAAG
jgi:hypothetical protein